MNSVFRKIRKKLIKGNRLKRYLIYAVGEIILVVIGILIALQVNNQNELRKKHNLEQKYIANIKTDLLSETKDLKNIIKRRKSKASSAQKMAEYHASAKIDTLKNYYVNFANVLYWEVHHPNDKTFRELVNSGNLSLIRNKEIKRNLLEMQNQYNQIQELREHTKHDYEMFFYNEYKDIFNFSTAINAWANPEGSHQFSQSEVEKCLKNDAIKNGFTLAAFNNAEMGNRSKEVLDIIEETINLIDSEIKKTN